MQNKQMTLEKSDLLYFNNIFLSTDAKNRSDSSKKSLFKLNVFVFATFGSIGPNQFTLVTRIDCHLTASIDLVWEFVICG